MSATRESRVAQAEAYVASRFFPALPAAYGELAVTALEYCNGVAENKGGQSGPDALVTMPADLNPLPRGAEVEPELGEAYIDAGTLVSILRLDHMVDIDEQEG